MVTIRIPGLDADGILEWLRQAPARAALYRRTVRALEAALRPPRRSPKAQHFALQAKKAKSLKHSTKREETRAIREACIERSGGKCECGCGLPVVDGSKTSAFQEADGELDHFIPRRHGQSVTTCWWIRRGCHWEKTNNRPSAAAWLGRFIGHCRKYGYDMELRLARARLRGPVAVKADEKRRRSGLQSSSPVEK